MELLSDTILVSIHKSEGAEKAVLVIGRKTKSNPVDIINAFQGEEAEELYKKLVTKKEEVKTNESDNS